MPQIRSDVNEVQSYTAGFNTVQSQLSSVTESEKDHQTTVAGNRHAHTAISETISSMRDLAVALNKLTANIKTVADDFEAIDQAQARTIAQK
ncbi:TIGR04197 family type VII secretion effector [Streptococcus sp. H31]|uniref:TIGR04197 family type VII secretion effector n=1 Tax=Streptococcus huangxiaojuni TaxID=3237239 RepID=UPI0034A2BBE7